MDWMLVESKACWKVGQLAETLDSMDSMWAAMMVYVKAGNSVERWDSSDSTLVDRLGSKVVELVVKMVVEMADD
jgi:hypothetical protein